jgi:hypothetical protein
MLNIFIATGWKIDWKQEKKQKRIRIGKMLWCGCDER